MWSSTGRGRVVRAHRREASDREIVCSRCLPTKERQMAFAELKARQSVMWGNGPYERITNTLRDIHELVIERADPKPGEQVLDAATGTGAVAILAAKRGANVVGQDLAPVLIETARERAGRGRRQGTVRGRRRGGHDVPECELRRRDVDVRGHVRARPPGGPSELARVTKPGGRLALACWTPEGGLGQMFRMMRAIPAAAGTEGAGSPFTWGTEEHVRELLGDDLRAGLRGARLAAGGRRQARSTGALLHLVRADEDRGGCPRSRAPRGVPPAQGRLLRRSIARATRLCITGNICSRSGTRR